MLSEEQIELLAIKHAPPVHPDYQDDDDWQEFARAIEREAYKQGQERMRERATLVCDKQHDAARTSPGAARAMFCSDAIRNLEIEEPK